MNYNLWKHITGGIYANVCWPKGRLRLYMTLIVETNTVWASENTETLTEQTYSYSLRIGRWERSKGFTTSEKIICSENSASRHPLSGMRIHAILFNPSAIQHVRATSNESIVNVCREAAPKYRHRFASSFGCTLTAV